MTTIVHFAVPSDNIERSKKFYSELFGWKIEKWHGSSDSRTEYWPITTTDHQGKEALGGVILTRQSPQHIGITNFIGVDSVDDYSSKIQKLGGKVVVPKEPAGGDPKNGFIAVCLDTENNTFGIWEHAAK